MHSEPVTSSNQALARGLHVLQMLVESPEPLTTTEIARRLNLHQSSISRILTTLAQYGYVRRPSRGRFAPDFGLLSLAASTIPKFSLVTRPRAAMEQIAELCPGFSVTLGALWKGRMIYFLRTSTTAPTIDFVTSDFPVHLSAPGLRLLLDVPREEALTILRGSRERFGWRGEDVVPSSEEAVLDFATAQVAHDVLILPGWSRRGDVGAAIPVQSPDEGQPPLALSLTGVAEPGIDPDTLRLWLHDGRRLLESALRTP
ncbi:helix-turn-helix domain-containing protein [Kribbella sp. NBC_00382]|uniref:IclR family transcriptional regulator n=1 Tax=Kribbella sp. NBC_00382 TaxID=2975967 RepID=UPI002E23D8A7